MCALAGNCGRSGNGDSVIDLLLIQLELARDVACRVDKWLGCRTHCLYCSLVGSAQSNVIAVAICTGLSPAVRNVLRRKLPVRVVFSP